MNDKPKTNLKHIVDHHALEAKYNEMKQNRPESDTMESKLGRKGVDELMKKMSKSDKESYMTPASVSAPSSPTSVAQDPNRKKGFSKSF
jgi:hypothetical protein